MKHLARLLSLLLLVSAGAFFSNCGGDDDKSPSEEETQLGKLKGTWTLNQATLDGDDKTSLFTGLTLTINGTNGDASYDYSFSGTRPNPSPWPASGEWTFVDGSIGSKIIRMEDDVVIDYTVTNSSLVLSFACVDCNFPGGRTESITGPWVFTFTK